MKNWIFILLFCAVVSNSYGQSDYLPQGKSVIWGPSVGYQYQSGNFVKVSGWGLFAPNESQYMKVDLGANFTWMQNQTTVVPELGLTYYLSTALLFPFVKAEANLYTVTPKVGISLLSIVDFAVGYGFDVQTKSNFKELKGITGSVSVNIPLNFYLK
ncbi:hypothetical protein [Sphingobacterium hungaricum]|uniref:Uncharacterized protein n=1 Tax=Sphingobacterium hungaricum TaxID=2082723 RepID=A0A928UX08_9SPHI|nr:hypothetical protein [Sphingobacterium hungaricum]MBE8712880.1 hypothetical protein [Sphingobacterium hungaricum]